MSSSLLCRGFPQTLVRVMNESLLGDPHTVFVEDKTAGAKSGARGFRYFRARSSNADWWQSLPTSFDREELRRAMGRVETCEPLSQKRREHRWLVEFIRDARKRGWCAAFNGKDSPLCVSPEPPMKRAKLGKDFRRVWLALPELDYTRLLLDARALHESPNLFVSGVLRERWVGEDERAGMQEPGPDHRLTGGAPF